MAKVVRLHGQRPGGWAKDRWAWIGAVMAASGLSPTTKLIAVTMAQGFANHETAECRPGLAALMAATSAARRTVLLALADLRKAGWIEPAGGEAPGRAAAYVFRWPGPAPERVQADAPERVQADAPERVQADAPERVQADAPERVQADAPERVQADAPERVQETTPTGAKNCTPPCTPYKDKPHMNHKSASHGPRSIFTPLPTRPTRLSALVQRGTGQEAAWNRWLAGRGFPDLDRIGREIVVGMIEGWDMPWRTPPEADDATGTRIAVLFAEWLRAKA